MHIIKKLIAGAAISLIFIAHSNAEIYDYIPWKLSEEDIKSTKTSFAFVKNNNCRMARINAKKASDTDIFNVIDWYCKYSGKSKEIFGNQHVPLDKKVERKEEDPIEKIKKEWIESDFDEKQEREFMKKNGNHIHSSDHVQHIEKLLWNGKSQSAQSAIEKMPQIISRDKKKIFFTRIALQNNDALEEKLLDSLDAQGKSDSGIIYDRIKFLHKKKDKKAVLDILLNHSNNKQYPEKFWAMKKLYAREMIYEKKSYQKAYNLCINHGLKSGKDLADAEWLAGFIALKYLDNPQLAFNHFDKMNKKVTLPLSKSRAQYWMGRAYEKIHGKDSAKRFYKGAGEYKYTFYGQIALLKLDQKITKSTTPHINIHDYEHYRNNIAAKALYISSYSYDKDITKKFAESAIKNARTNGERFLITFLPAKLKIPYTSIYTSKLAESEGIKAKDSILYPSFIASKIGKLPIEMELLTSIVRQESLFDYAATSSAGATGLTQMLPGTAHEISSNANVKYEEHYLKDPRYNLQISATHLKELMDKYDNSFALVFAAYNSGPKNANRWMRDIGDPRKFSSADDIVDWIEKVSYYETRDYIQRVIANYNIYKALSSNYKSNIVIN